MIETKHEGFGYTTYSRDDSVATNYVRRDHIVTSVNVTPNARHDRVTIFSRGGNAGEIVVDAGDGKQIAQRLLDWPRAEQ